MISNRIVQKNGSQIVSSRLWGWGRNSGNVIRNSGGPFSVPTMSDETPNFIQISHGKDFACGIDENNDLWCWGSNGYGQVGDGTTTDRTDAIRIGIGFKSVSCGLQHAVAINNSDFIYTWGRNNFGQLGDGTTSNVSSPAKIGTNQYIKASAGLYHTLGITKVSSIYGEVMAWGRNNYGQVGDGTTNNKSSPVKISTYYYTNIAAGGYHSLSTRYNSNGFYSWGLNQDGQLGLGNTTNRSSPTFSNYVPAILSSVHARGKSSAIIYNNSLYTFGSNNYGQLGTNNYVNYSVPTQVGPPNQILEFNMAGTGNNLASFFIHYTDKTLYSCGTGSAYLTGQGTAANSTTFTQVGSYNDWKHLSNGGENTSTDFVFMLALRY